VKKDKILGEIFSNIWIPIISVILSFILGLVVSYFRERIGIVSLSFALGVILIIFILAMYIVSKNIYPVSIKLLDKIMNSLERYVEKDTITWILTQKQLLEYEENLNIKDIWLVTFDIADDIPGGLYCEAVEKNLKSGVKYKYFIPKRLEAEARGGYLIEYHQNNKNLEIIYLSDDFFFLVPSLDFAIYDPLNKFGKREGYMGLPIKSNIIYEGKMKEDFLDLLIGKLQKVLQERLLE